MPENKVLDNNPIFSRNDSDNTQRNDVKDSTEFKRDNPGDLVVNGGKIRAEVLGLDKAIEEATQKKIDESLDKSY